MAAISLPARVHRVLFKLNRAITDRHIAAVAVLGLFLGCLHACGVTP